MCFRSGKMGAPDGYDNPYAGSPRTWGMRPSPFSPTFASVQVRSIARSPVVLAPPPRRLTALSRLGAFPGSTGPPRKHSKAEHDA